MFPGLERWLQRVLCIGLVWLIVGMAVMPAGVSYDPGHAYQYVLGVTLYLPALLLVALRPGSVQVLWRQPSTKWVLLLLAWGAMSLLWSNARHPDSGVARDLSILLFLYGWARVTDGFERRIPRILMGCGAAMAVVALVAMFVFRSQLLPGGRLMGFGVMHNANLAAAAMAAAALWLCAFPCQAPAQRVGRALAAAVLLLFVFMTFTRSAWGALFLALLVMAACRPGSRTRRHVAWLILLAAVVAVVGMPELTARGWSMRPEILQRSWELFAHHPWFGLGQGAVFRIDVGDMVLTHAHNMFSQLAIELGLPGLLLWLGTWFALGWRGWLNRREPLGRLVLATWVFATIMTQFDLPHLLASPRPAWLIAWLPLAIGYSLKPLPASAASNPS